MTDKITPIVFEPTKTIPGMEIRERSKFIRSSALPPFGVTLWNDGFEATRYTSLDELEELRNWLNDVLMEKKRFGSAEANS